MGRDLQFIRINGTVVGALAGLVIYTVGPADHLTCADTFRASMDVANVA